VAVFELTTVKIGDERTINHALFTTFEPLRLWLKERQIKAPFRKIVVSLNAAFAAPWNGHVANAIGICQVTEAMRSEPISADGTFAISWSVPADQWAKARRAVAEHGQGSDYDRRGLARYYLLNGDVDLRCGDARFYGAKYGTHGVNVSLFDLGLALAEAYLAHDSRPAGVRGTNSSTTTFASTSQSGSRSSR
jgi:hypothetical protein